jgi:hypothetical protein
MTLSPTTPSLKLETPDNTESAPIDNHQDEIVDTHTTPLRLPPRSARKSLNAQKKLEPGKGKKWRTRNEGIDGKWYVERDIRGSRLIFSYLLNLPADVLHILLAKLPPRTLKALSVTCKTLQEDLSIEGIWRECYANRFMWDGAALEVTARDEMKVLVQGCMGDGGRGWRREALNREAMLEYVLFSRGVESS